MTYQSGRQRGKVPVAVLEYAAMLGAAVLVLTALLPAVGGGADERAA